MDFQSGKYVETFTNMMSEGFIVIDKEGTIQIYNDKAQDIFRINQELDTSHESGHIKKGDIVIIGSNSMGDDDGNLKYEDLECLGIKDPNINQKDAIVAMGIYKDDNIKPVYKFIDKDQKKNKLTLETDFLDMLIRVAVNFEDQLISIDVDEMNFSMNYRKSIGHMVILDGETKNIKFYQYYGYTARGESLNDILKGSSYKAKGKGSQHFRVLGKNIFDINKSDNIIQKFYDVAQGKDVKIENEFEDINGISTLCTAAAVRENGEIVGAALKVEDISLIESAIMERDNAIKRLKKAEEKLLEDERLDEAFPKFVGDSDAIKSVKKMALKASKTQSNVLLLGESGTGKTVLAKYIHGNSKVKDKPFVQINCGAIPENLLESELFGYEAGAFTGARSQGKKGLFEIADGGTIFLDEIGDMPLNLQVKLLQTIQDKSFYRVGGTEEIKVNIRIISATNKNLETEMMEGRFREDLYYRINVFPILIPPLKERKEDIIPLIDLILPRICREIEVKEKTISMEAKSALFKHDWPGNIRELENILERAVNLSEGDTILSKNIIINGRQSEKSIESLKSALEKEERKIIEETLKAHGGNRTETMKALDISRSNFYKKLNDYNIN